MSVTAASLRTAFPEFADTARFPDAGVNFWLARAINFVSEPRWGVEFDLGVQLWTCHQLVLERRALDEATIATATGKGAPGVASGPISAKSVDKVSVAYATADASETDAGNFNLTIYGQRFFRLAMMMGSGGVQVC